MKVLIKVICCFLFTTIAGCERQDKWLDLKSKNSDVIVSKIEDCQALLDNTLIFNQTYSNIGLVSTDNLYIDNDLWQSIYYKGWRELYVFGPSIFADETGGSYSDWENPYKRIAYCNIVLETLDKIKKEESNKAAWENAKGSALFFRAWSFYGLLNEFSKPYLAGSASADLGIPLRLSSDANIKEPRASVQKCYDIIIADLQDAEPLLPDRPSVQTRPGRQALQGLLAKIFLNKGDNENAILYAGKALESRVDLIDFNALDAKASFPFATFPNNKELLIYAESEMYDVITNISAFKVDSILFDSYHTDDLRKQVFYTDNGKSGISFKGNYTGNAEPFAGIAANELFLIRAEALARQGNINAATDDLNYLLERRWKKGKYQPIAITDQEAVLKVVLEERRKELPFTSNVRWEDLRRLNQDKRFETEVVHKLNGEQYVLKPNSSRYILDIPAMEIRLGGIEQNVR